MLLWCICRKLAVYDHWSGLVLHIAMDNCVVVDDIRMSSYVVLLEMLYLTS